MHLIASTVGVLLSMFLMLAVFISPAMAQKTSRKGGEKPMPDLSISIEPIPSFRRITDAT